MLQQLALNVLDESLLYYKETIFGTFNLTFFTFSFPSPFVPKFIDSHKHGYQEGQHFKVFLEGIINVKRKEVKSGLVEDDIVSLVIRDPIENDVNDLTNKETLNDLTVLFVSGQAPLLAHLTQHHVVYLNIK
ncbi:hypothetical protein K502DRAFT_348097 [Neoconidiobolus thromboides FSU 785]|nr:hypothetical protein K502DRAFT_348097 [Neoconidiobolus thromboides FSU 785]